MCTFLEPPQQARLPSWLDGRHPLYLTEDRRLIDEDAEALDRETFIRMREELGARILTNARGKVAQALGFSGRSRHAESSKLCKAIARGPALRSRCNRICSAIGC